MTKHETPFAVIPVNLHHSHDDYVHAFMARERAEGVAEIMRKHVKPSLTVDVESDYRINEADPRAAWVISVTFPSGAKLFASFG